MLEYVTRLTETPGDMDAIDVEALRDAGFDDLAIHDICAVAAYYAFVNRIADGLGVELEDRPGADDLGFAPGDTEDDVDPEGAGG